MSSNPHPAPAATSPSRRRFFRDSSLLLAGGAFAGPLPVARSAHAFGSDLIRIGLIGCGTRGTEAAMDALAAGSLEGEVRLTAMADVFPDRIQASYRAIKGKHPQRVEVTAETRFVGLDAFEPLLAADVDLVILATPPGFRPLHFERAVAAGKHVFMESPVAVDPPGVRRILAAGRTARDHGLAVHVESRRRHDPRYVECIRQIHDGVIGKPLFARAYWNGGGLKPRARRDGQSELEYQLANWTFFNWLSGDQITEQHVRNLDVINWALGGRPLQAQGQGGRDARRSGGVGDTFDQHMVEYTYEGGTRLLSQCRRVSGCWAGVGEHVHGTLGSCDLSAAAILDLQGNIVRQSDNDDSADAARHRQMSELFRCLRQGEAVNEAETAAMSTMTAILGRMATYSGRTVKWDAAMQNAVTLSDVDRLRSLDDPAPLLPDVDGGYPIPLPGQPRGPVV